MVADRAQTPSTLMGAILVIVGIVLFFVQWMGAGFWGWTWPLSIIMVGLLFFGGMVVGGRKLGGLAIPGSIITTVGLILFFQNLTGRFESWSYVWTLIPVAVGIGIAIHGVWSGRTKMIRSGWRLIVIGAMLLVTGFVFFEITLNLSGLMGGGGSFVGPLLLVGIGLFAVRRGVIGWRDESATNAPSPRPKVTAPIGAVTQPLEMDEQALSDVKG